MTRIFIIENNLKENKFLRKKLGTKFIDSFDSKDINLSIKQAEKDSSDDCVIYEIEIPEVNACGFVRVLHQGSITANIPFSYIHDRQSNLEQSKDINYHTDKHLGDFYNLTELVKKITDLKQYLQNSQLQKKSISNNHWSANQSQPILEPIPAKTTKSTDDKSKFSQDPLLNQVFQFIDRNYHLTITLCDVALAVGYSAAYLTDLVRRQTGKTVNNWIIERRMTAARQLLLETNQSVNQVALAVGYQNEGHFFRQFRQHHEITPQVWRKIQRQIEAKELRVSQKDCAL
ncbi:helix-turn-helix domain-containing protein [Nostoc sp. UHCC 0870]|uniref:helix-turn-helix domain-containing protein n=1 Tax=Nostoc sp. UHCC 0870 TaxID=2914041 RepID=UPI001EDFC42E|nr:AraC family transcriptional regulator [Nostoc sp. UHCC 0870]UKO96716.1 AraC family transcriptional regulator [Nostoc sp. UHCC 0870]